MIASLLLLAFSSFVTMVLILVVYRWHREDTERRVSIVVNMQREIVHENTERAKEHAELRRLLLRLTRNEFRAVPHDNR